MANFHISLDPIRLFGNEMPEATSAHKEKFFILSHFPIEAPLAASTWGSYCVWGVGWLDHSDPGSDLGLTLAL